MARFEAHDTMFRDYDAIRLVAGDLEATFLPSAGMLCASLKKKGEEFLGRMDEFEKYIESGTTVGIPLLHPWANRLETHFYTAGVRGVVLDRNAEMLHYDANKLPMHGVRGAYLAFEVEEEEADESGASIAAHFDWMDTDFLQYFPFPHYLDIDVTLDAGGLTIETTIEPGGDVPVPVSFGYHPYFCIPGVPRSEWILQMPGMRRLVLDKRLIPTGVEELFSWNPRALGQDSLDDLFCITQAKPRFVLTGGDRRIEINFLEGYSHAQVYAPAGHDYIAIEPMTAPTNALVQGHGLRLVPVGSSFTAAFQIKL